MSLTSLPYRNTIIYINCRITSQSHTIWLINRSTIPYSYCIISRSRRLTQSHRTNSLSPGIISQCHCIRSGCISIHTVSSRIFSTRLCLLTKSHSRCTLCTGLIPECNRIISLSFSRITKSLCTYTFRIN